MPGKFVQKFIFICILVYSNCAWAADYIDVTIEGVGGRALSNIRSFLSIEQQKQDENLTDERIRKLFNKANKEIRQALQPFGYYDPDISAELSRTDNGWKAQYKVDIGAPVLLSEVLLTINGAAGDDTVFEKLKNNFSLKTGNRFDHVQYENAKTALLNLASSRGYFDAVLVKKEVQVDIAVNQARVELVLDSGPRYLFGRVTFIQKTFSDDFLDRFVPFKEGLPYTLEKFQALESALRNSDYFDDIQINLLKEKAVNQVVPVEVVLEPRNRTKYTAGVGYGTDTGARIKLGIERRRVNRFGHKANTEFQESRILDEVTVRYIIPLKKPQSDQFVISTGWRKEDINDIESVRKTISFSHTHLSRHWQKTYYLNYELEDFSIGTDTRDSVLVMPGMKWTRIKANDRIHTTYGNKIVIDVRGGSETLGSTSSFLQTRLGLKFIRRFFDMGRFIARSDIGYSNNMNFVELPPSVRFFAGGDQSVRGYGFNTLGPVDADGVVIGGENLLVASLELEFDYNESWSWATFYDAGNAMDNFGEDLKRGTGAGIRYRSVIGQFRLDLASALDKPGNPWRLHLSIGIDL